MSRISSLLLILVAACQPGNNSETTEMPLPESPYLIILGTAQDAGYPQSGCYEEHCMRAWHNPDLKRSATSLALVDPDSKKKWLFEATPNIKEQLFMLEEYAPDSLYELAGIFLTHAHMGHYTGLMHLGRESMNARGVEVYAMPRMGDYLSSNGPWDQLVKLQNIVLEPLEDSAKVELTSSISVLPFKVPHRDEYTETVGYQVMAENRKALFIPDIDKWGKWSQKVIDVVKQNNYSLLDATFFSEDELPGRDMSEIPHPFVVESVDLLSRLDEEHKSGIHFIHFNHSNPLLDPASSSYQFVINKGFKVAQEGMIIDLR